MGRREIPDLTKRSIQRAYECGEGSHSDLAGRFNVSVPTVRRLCKGLVKGSKKNSPITGVINDAIATGIPIEIGGVRLDEMLANRIKDMEGKLGTARVNTYEGLASAMLRWTQLYLELNPPTIEALVDKLIAHPEFEPNKFVELLKKRYAQQKAS